MRGDQHDDEAGPGRPGGETLSEFRARARRWLECSTSRRQVGTSWGLGSDSVALFQNMTADDEARHIAALRAWTAKKVDAGFASLTWETLWGGQDLPQAYEAVFAEEEAAFAVPAGHEAVGITVHLVAPTVRAHGSETQRQRFLRSMLRTDEMWCQLFSEPGAGSDLAGLATRAVRDGDTWIVNGQKVWTSGAQYADWGYLMCRTDTSVPKHRGLTAFIVPMRAAGVEVRPLKQMTGGSSFNEVFFSDVRLPDSLRLGPEGEGWRVALTTLGFERGSTTSGLSDGTSARLAQLAVHLGCSGDALVRQQLADATIRDRLLAVTDQRARARRLAGDTPGPEGSIGKLSWTEGLRRSNDALGRVLGPRLAADTREWGTYAWTERVLGTAGYRIAGGTDEIQRNIIGERVLGLPREPRFDRDSPLNDPDR